MGLVTAQKPDSQEICFVMDDDYTALSGELQTQSNAGYLSIQMRHTG